MLSCGGTKATPTSTRAVPGGGERTRGGVDRTFRALSFAIMPVGYRVVRGDAADPPDAENGSGRWPGISWRLPTPNRGAM